MYDESNPYLEVEVCFHRNHFHSYSCKTYPNIGMREKWNEIPFPTVYSLIPNAPLVSFVEDFIHHKNVSGFDLLFQTYKQHKSVERTYFYQKKKKKNTMQFLNPIKFQHPRQHLVNLVFFQMPNINCVFGSVPTTASNFTK